MGGVALKNYKPVSLALKSPPLSFEVGRGKTIAVSIVVKIPNIKSLRLKAFTFYKILLKRREKKKRAVECYDS